MEIMVVKRAAKASLVPSTGIAESCGLSSDVCVVDLDEKVDGDSRAKHTVSRSSAEAEDKNAFKVAVPHCVPGGGSVRK